MSDLSGPDTSSITFWARLEPSIRNGDFDDVFAARVGDPLWLLGRQLQLGEFEGSDSGSAIRTDVDYEFTQVSRYRAGKNSTANTVIPYPQDKPLNVLAEPEAIQGDLRTAAALGLDFLRILQDRPQTDQLLPSDFKTVREYYINKYDSFNAAEDSDGPTRRFLVIAKKNAFDGVSLYQDFKKSQPSLPPQQINDFAHQPYQLQGGNAISTLTAAANAYVDYYEEVFSVPQKGEVAWASEQLEYQFELAAAKDQNSSIILSADEYEGGEIDWYSFSLNPSSDLASSPGDSKTLSGKETLTVVPSHLQFRGLPGRRWWQFEDAQLDMGSIDVNKTDIPRMAIINMVVNQANSWFIMPFVLNRGTLTRINSVTVTDTFGRSTDIRPANLSSFDAKKPWRMFVPSLEKGLNAIANPDWSNFLFLPPVSGQILDGATLESVNFLKDQMAEMVWGVEDTIQNPAGDPVEGYFNPTKPQRPVNSSNPPHMPKYVLMTQVPLNWIPFLPVQVPNAQMTKLQEGSMSLPPAPPDNQPKAILPRGVILRGQPNQAYYVREEEVPREGAIVTRKFRRTRWTDGSIYLWVAREKEVGKGEGSSGLRFDSVDENPQ